MRITKIDFENCYGIKKLEFTFNFNENRTYAIYAPNGAMKTSFAKAFFDFSTGEKSKDLIFPERVNKRILLDENNLEISTKNIFVIEPYNQTYKSDKISTLLVNKELKKNYDEIHLKIDEKKDALIKALKKLSGLKKDIEETLSDAFTHSPKEFFKSIIRVKSEVLDKAEPVLGNIIYTEIFNAKVVSFLETKDFKDKLSEYMSKYDELIASSIYFKKGIFNHNNASTIAKNLKDNGFFKAKHSIFLNSEKDKKEITTEAQLVEVIQQEKDRILNNSDLAKAFDEIDDELNRNVDMKKFRAYLIDNPIILPELSNLNELKQKLWIAYLKLNVELYKQLEEEFSIGKQKIEDIILQAKREETEWLNVIDIFNKRFSVPFKVAVDNQEDVILRSEAPNIKFIFYETADQTSPVEEADLLKVLSNGEKRALYILNIIYEVQARKNNMIETLFIIDDIADSFDYKNKYAIVEYLKEISEEEFFFQIILTHNFDFYRTISSRLEMNRQHKLNTIKTNDGIKLVEEKYQNNPFTHWKQNLHCNNSMLIASIPFVRNIAEFSGYTEHYKKLTSLLHVKEDTKDIDINLLETINKELLKDKINLVLENPTKKVIDLIFEVADQISIDSTENIDLENKIALSIAIRLKAEQYMIRTISDDVFWKGIEKHQTRLLFKKYQELFPDRKDKIKLLEQVNLMTPDNIHINSFMYEPILDMANNHLRSLYVDIKTLEITI